FVGHQHRNFRFDRRLRALTGVARARLENEVAQGFPSLPPGCVIDLDRDVHEIVLKNVRQALQLSWRDLTAELRTLGDISLSQFLVETGLDVDDLYRRRGWLALRRAAGYASGTESSADTELERAFGRMLHLDDPERLDHLTGLLSGHKPESDRDRRL